MANANDQAIGQNEEDQQAMLEPASDSSETRPGADLFAHTKANDQHRRGAGYVVDRLQENLPDKIECQI